MSTVVPAGAFLVLKNSTFYIFEGQNEHRRARRGLFGPQNEHRRSQDGPGSLFRGLLSLILRASGFILEQLGFDFVNFGIALAPQRLPKLLHEAIGLTLQNL